MQAHASPFFQNGNALYKMHCMNGVYIERYIILLFILQHSKASAMHLHICQEAVQLLKKSDGKNQSVNK